MHKKEWVVMLTIIAFSFLSRAFMHTNDNYHFPLFLLCCFMARPVIHNFNWSLQSFKALIIGTAFATCVMLFPYFSTAGETTDTYISIAIGIPFSLALDFDFKDSSEKTAQPTKNWSTRFICGIDTAVAWTACMCMLHGIFESNCNAQTTPVSIALFFIARGVAINSIVRNKSIEGILIGIPVGILLSGLFFAGVIENTAYYWISGISVALIVATAFVLRIVKHDNISL